MAQISARLALVTRPAGLLDRERLGSQEAPPAVWNVTLKMLLGNKVVAIKPWGSCWWAPLVCKRALQGLSAGWRATSRASYPSLLCANKQGEASGHA